MDPIPIKEFNEFNNRQLSRFAGRGGRKNLIIGIRHYRCAYNGTTGKLEPYGYWKTYIYIQMV